MLEAHHTNNPGNFFEELRRKEAVTARLLNMSVRAASCGWQVTDEAADKGKLGHNTARGLAAT